MFDSYWYEIAPEDYIFDASPGQDGLSICALSITANYDDFFLLGNNFMRGYYLVHDMQDGFLGTAPNRYSDKDYIFRGEIPSRTLHSI
jgi:hypothetical protein